MCGMPKVEQNIRIFTDKIKSLRLANHQFVWTNHWIKATYTRIWKKHRNTLQIFVNSIILRHLCTPIIARFDHVEVSERGIRTLAFIVIKYYGSVGKGAGS